MCASTLITGQGSNKMSDDANAVEARDALIMSWLEQVKASKLAVETERETRKLLMETLFPTPTKGTQRFPLPAGYAIKLVYGLDYKLGDKDKLDEEGRKVPISVQVDEILDQIVALGNEGPLLAERLVKWVPELSVTEYEKLDPDYDIQEKARNLIDSVLTVKPASPQMAFEEPKVKGSAGK